MLQALLGQRGTAAVPAAADEVFYTSETDAQPLASGAPPWCHALLRASRMLSQSLGGACA